MRSTQRATWASLFLTAATVSGCAFPSPWDAQAANNFTTAARPATGSVSGLAGVPATGGMAAGGGTFGGAPAPIASPGSAGLSGAGMPNALAGSPSPLRPSNWLASLQSSTQSLVAAAQIKPHTIPAIDPTKLDNQPANKEAVAADLHYHAGRVFETQDSWETAAMHYRTALSRTPNDVRLLTSCARVEDRLGRVAEADSLYRRAIELKPNDPSPYNDLALCHARHRNYDVALGLLQKAIQLAPQDKLYRNNLALVLVDAGRHDDALQQLLVAHSEAVAHYNLGYMLLERNARDLAAMHIQRAVQLDPQLAAARQLLDELQRGVTSLTPGTVRRLPRAESAPGENAVPRTMLTSRFSAEHAQEMPIFNQGNESAGSQSPQYLSRLPGESSSTTMDGVGHTFR